MAGPNRLIDWDEVRRVSKLARGLDDVTITAGHPGYDVERDPEMAAVRRRA